MLPTYFKCSPLLLNLPRNITSVSAKYCDKGEFKELVKIANVSKPIFKTKSPHLIPVGYLPKTPNQSLIRHLQWIMKKDLLKQDMFLIGLPGPLRGRIILQYLEIMQQEVEYVVLSRDTTENDLKQRREILEGTARYIDQSAVRAAIEGRFLILDGIEKVERNVLPVLNNLLENREMQLEDGRFLIAPERYDKLLSEHSKKILDDWKLVRVSENFRVVALGLPVPPFKGNPLDPPFRSRFQARFIELNFEEQISEFCNQHYKISKDALKNFLSACYTFISNESAVLGLPKFPIENLYNALELLNKFSNLPIECVLKWMYPYSLLSEEAQKAVLHTLKTFAVSPQKVRTNVKVIENVSGNNKFSCQVEFHIDGEKTVLDVLGHKRCNGVTVYPNFIPNPYHDSILAAMFQTHTVQDFCIIGNKGSGKSILVKQFASLLNYPVEMVMLFKDMTARDLLQQRITDEKGNTLWRPSQLVKAAQEGKLLVLDGLHRLHSSTLSVLQRLIHDREMQLYDGTRLLQHDRYKLIKEKCRLSDKEMEDRKLLPIHPSFRIIALAESPKQSSQNIWMTPELMPMFLFHVVRPLSLKEEKMVIQSLVGKISEKIDLVLNFAHALRSSKDEALQSVSGSFSTRQLIRIARRLSSFPNESVHSLITQACLLKFLPQLTKQAIENVLEGCGINDLQTTVLRDIDVKEGKLRIGSTSASVSTPGSSKVKVPEIIFYDSQEHLEVMEAMLQDFLLGEHLLLIGNQGVGKNKIADRFLQLLNRPREYIQLHRDTTVQSLTQQPTVVDGKIVYEDSPLLRAVQLGHILVVDEADKAPTHVTSILKALVESGEMMLSDGRRVIHHTDAKSLANSDTVIMHPDFRMIILANRPGFPFLGNDFFATLGDIFSCHAVDNPTLESEISMLHQYGPQVPEYVLRKLTKFFGELRSMSDSGLISYPYSTREVVNVVRHLNKYPEDGLSHVLKNVFDFDNFSFDLKETLEGLFEKHGIPSENQTIKVKIADKFHLPKPHYKAEWQVQNISDCWTIKLHKLYCENICKLPVLLQNLDFADARATLFSEQQSYYQLPLNDDNIPTDMATSPNLNDGIIYVATANPVSLFKIDTVKTLLSCVNLSGYFPTVRSGFKPKINISALSSPYDGFVFFHESMTEQMFLVNPSNGIMNKLQFFNVVEETVSKITRAVYSKSVQGNLQFHVGFPSGKKILLCSKYGSKLILLDLHNNQTHHVEPLENIKQIIVLDETSLILRGEANNFIVDISDPSKWLVREIKKCDDLFGHSNLNIKLMKNHNVLSDLNEINNNVHKALVSNSEDYASIISGSFFNGNILQVMGYPRNNRISLEDVKSCILPVTSQIVRFFPSNALPQRVNSDNKNSGYLEVVDVKDSTYYYLPISFPPRMSPFASWLANTSEQYLIMCVSPAEELFTADAKGCIRKWEINQLSLSNSFQEWRKLVGLDSNEQLSIEYVNPNPVSEPKHGKVDSTGAPHVGGNTWAGGTGGRDTAGLGGKGGPYRLDAGHNVFQVSDAEKEAVPLEVKNAARKMAMKAYKDKLKEIEMSEYDAELYENFLCNVKKQINTLRVILEGLQAKSKERLWLKHQTSGEFDDTKLIESITGEKNIYKKRGDQEPEVGSPQEKPKLIRLVVDVSGSMYRFNGHDNRLQRELESVVLVMEAFDGYREKFQYEIIGHSGEHHCIEFVQFGSPPKNNKERLNILKKMYAHSQFCMSGDNTLEATSHAIKTITKNDADEYFVIVLSDANFDRYGISPKSFGNLLVSDAKVNAFVIFIGSLGNQASVLSKKLPAGRGFICFDSSNLTEILQKIFTSALLRD